MIDFDHAGAEARWSAMIPVSVLASLAMVLPGAVVRPPTGAPQADVTGAGIVTARASQVIQAHMMPTSTAQVPRTGVECSDGGSIVRITRGAHAGTSRTPHAFGHRP